MKQNKATVAGTTLVIEKNIPIPPKGGRGAVSFAAIIRQLEVGDSILIMRGAAATHSIARHTLGVGKYTVRKEGDSYRIWRTA